MYAHAHMCAYHTIPVNIPPMIAQTPVKKCMKDLKQRAHNYVHILLHTSLKHKGKRIAVDRKAVSKQNSVVRSDRFKHKKKE